LDEFSQEKRHRLDCAGVENEPERTSSLAANLRSQVFQVPNFQTEANNQRKTTAIKKEKERRRKGKEKKKINVSGNKARK